MLFFLMQRVTAAAMEPAIGSVQDRSSPGPFSVEVLDFPKLQDSRDQIEEIPESPTGLRSRWRRPQASRVRPQPGRSNALQIRPVPMQVHIPKTGGPFPIVVVSHGDGGNLETHFAQAQHLASHGYAVVCVEHSGSNTERLKRNLRLIENLNQMIRDPNEILGRPKDIRFAVDQCFDWNKSHSSLRGRLDTAHVGVLGHSFGAYTTMVVCGMRPALDWLEPGIKPGKGLGPDLADPRISCGVALSPQGADEPFFLRESFDTLKVPLMGISGTEDRQQGGLPPMNRYQAFDLWPANQARHYFIWLANAHHLDFTDSAGANQQGIRSANREDVQKVVRAASLLFLNANLKSDRDSANELNDNGLQRYLHGPIDHVEVRVK